MARAAQNPVPACYFDSAAAHRTIGRAETVPAGQDVALPMASFDDGRARFYRYVTAAGDEIRFFVIKNADGVARAGFDACDICFRQRRGFRQVGSPLICNHCGRAFLPQHVGAVRGGCNPAPLEHAAESDRLIITAAPLEQGASYFVSQ